MRRRSRPQRRIADELLVAGVADGTPVLLNPVATILWDALEGWQDEHELTDVLARRFPDVDQANRARAVADALALLDEEDLLEHAGP